MKTIILILAAIATMLFATCLDAEGQRLPVPQGAARASNTAACATSGQCRERHYHADGREQWKSPGQDDL